MSEQTHAFNAQTMRSVACYQSAFWITDDDPACFLSAVQFSVAVPAELLAQCHFGLHILLFCANLKP